MAVRILRVSLFLLVFPWAVFAAETGGSEPDPWESLAGREAEADAEALELRDELVAANLSFLSALNEAASEAVAFAEGDPRRPLAWARVEYLIEASFRLLAGTGEYEAFLAATAPLVPSAPAASEAVPLDRGGGGFSGGEDGGLLFRDAAGRRLLPTRIAESMKLVGPDGAEVGDRTEGVVARPPGAEPRTSVSIPLVKARAAWLRALACERLGRAEAAMREAAPLGMVRDWLLLGPLDRDPDFLAGDSPSAGDLAESFDPGFLIAGKNGPVRWRAFSSSDPLGRLFAEAAFGNDGPAMAYALALVHSPADQAADVSFGTSGPATVWVNNAQIHSSTPVGEAIPDQESFRTWLRRGWNVVVLKTLSAPDNWRAAMRIVLPDGSPFPGYVAPAAQADIPRILEEGRKAVERTVLDRWYSPETGAELGGLSALSRHLGKSSDDARANFYLASLLAARRLMEGSDRFDRELIYRRAIELSGGDPYFTLMAARAAEAGVEGVDREENLRLLLLRLAADRGSAAALVDMGRLYLDTMRQPRRAGEYASRAAEANPISLRAAILLHDATAARGWRPEAESILARLRQSHPDALEVRLRLGRAALERGRFRAALSEFSAVLGIDAGNDEALHGAVTALGRLGQTSAAVDLLAGRVRNFPYDSRAWLRLAGLYRSLGREGDAMAAILAVLAVNPDDAAALSARDGIVGEEAFPADDGGAAEPDLDLSAPDVPSEQSPEGWEYIYFQLEDRMERNGSIGRRISFAARISSERGCAALRHLDFGMDEGLESAVIERLAVIRPGGRREELTPPSPGRADGAAFRLPPLTPGTIIVASVEIRRRRIAFLGDYFGQMVPLGQTVPVRLSRYLFTSPRDRRLFFQPVNGAPQAMMVETPDRQGITRIWEMDDLPAYPEEPYGPGRNSVMPCVQMSSFGDWDEFSRWYWRLIAAQYHAPPELRLLARRAAEGGEAHPLARLDRAAGWIADNLGNRDWEFGPYAFRPISVRAILSRRTADGKDRTLLLCLLAREYGLDAWPVLARSWEAWRPLPGAQSLDLPLLDHFNHSLAAVDAGSGGQVLLDASNPHRPSGVMPATLFGAPAVRLTPASAERMVVPDGGMAGCGWDETVEVTVDPDGSILWEESVRGTGTAAEALRSRFADPKGRDAAWEAFLAGEGGQSSAAAVDFSAPPEDPASASFSGRSRLRGFCSSSSGRMMARLPSLPGRKLVDGDGYEFPLSLDFLVGRGERGQDLLLPSAFRLARRISVAYPAGWRLANPPADFREEYPFGTLEVDVSAAPGTLDVSYALVVPVRRIAAGDFAAFRRAAAVARRWRRPELVWESTPWEGP